MIENHIDDNNTLKDFQFGFRKGLSTTHALMALANKVSAGFNNRSATIAVSLDFERRLILYGKQV